MKIGFDISQLAHQGGVATYTQNLTANLVLRKDLEMIFFYSSLRKPYHGNLPNVKTFPLPPTITEYLFNRFRKLPIEFFLGPLDIFHSSDWMQPSAKAKKVTTYHDIIPIKYPEWSNPKIVEVHKRRLKLVEEEIDMVIAVSNATKRDLVEISNIPEEKITVIYEAAADYFTPQPEKNVEEFIKKYNLPREFVLAIGGIGERRNLNAVKEASKGYHLVVTGATLPWIAECELPLLYSAAKVLFYPSFYEGFGLPVLEAMACGTPVITSNISSLPEVGGDAVSYVDPKNLDEMKKVVREVMEDRKLQVEMKKKGLAQAKKFSWEKAAQETKELYERIIGKS